MKKTSTAFNVLVVNPGSTSTRLALFVNHDMRQSRTLRHSAADLKRCSSVPAARDYRLGLARSFLSDSAITRVDAIAARGGLLRPVRGGVYRVNKRMLRDLAACRYGEHASNTGALCAALLAKEYRCPAFIADPVTVDEMDAVARITGIPEIKRTSVFHALNQKAAARAVARKLGKRYDSCNFIVAHMGGGISVGAHRKGRVVDVNNALDGDGPFSPGRAGRLPAGDCIRLCAEFRGPTGALLKKITSAAGLVAHLGTDRLPDVLKRIRNGDNRAKLVFLALAYQVSKEIAMHGATLKGKVDAVILTGGLAHSRELVREISGRVSFLAPVHVLPGEEEMEALASAVLRVLRGKERAKEY